MIIYSQYFHFVDSNCLFEIVKGLKHLDILRTPTYPMFTNGGTVT